VRDFSETHRIIVEAEKKNIFKVAGAEIDRRRMKVAARKIPVPVGKKLATFSSDTKCQ